MFFYELYYLCLDFDVFCSDNWLRKRHCSTQQSVCAQLPFFFSVNMELPLYSSLQHPSNAVLITTAGVGANGVIVFNAGGSYRAYEANCPNQYISSCSRLEIDGIKAICPCDELEYSLFTGVPFSEGEYTLIPYRVEQNG